MQGRHTDRLITVCYLPVTLVMLLVMIHYNHRTNIALRISGGMAGFCLSMIAVPLVSTSFPACRSKLHAHFFSIADRKYNLCHSHMQWHSVVVKHVASKFT